MSLVSRRFRRRTTASWAFTLALGTLLAAGASSEEALVKLPNSKPARVSNALALGALDRNQHIQLAIALPLRNQKELDSLLQRLYQPGDPLYRKYLSPEEFTQRFGPTQADYDAVIAYFHSKGVTIAATHPNRAILDIEGPVGTVEGALNVHFNAFKGADGRAFYAADAAPSLPASIAGRLKGIVGMDNAVLPRPNFVVKQRKGMGGPGNGGGVVANGGGVTANGIGTGPLGGLAPNDIKTAYSINEITIPSNGLAPNGTGQVLAVLELDGYVPSYIQAYEKYFGLPNTKITNVNVDGGPGGVGSGEVEVALDLELMIALDSHATIYDYQGPNSYTTLVDITNKMATDNKASAISTSWGQWEDEYSDNTIVEAEAIAFQEMAAQGQSMFAASGDYGAIDPYTYDSDTNGYTASVQDPASQPYVTGVGGTTLSVANPGVDESYAGETTWVGSGGGVSSFWSIPNWQIQTDPWFNGGSPYSRNVPDVSLNADPNTGYDIYSYDYGGWVTVGGTSAASPLWAGFVGLVNQGRAVYKLGRAGFANAVLYGIYTDTLTGYSGGYYDFFDINTGNNDLAAYYGYTPNYEFYAGNGYDDCTGLGSFDAWQLFYEMIQAPTQLSRPLPPATVTVTPGDTTAVVTWSKSLGATKYYVYQSDSTGLHLLTITSALTYKPTHLVNGDAYYYMIIAWNTAGTSNYSVEPGTTPAVVKITVAPSAAPTSGQAVITWTTNVLSNSTVSWGTTKTSLTHVVTSATEVVNHSVTITGLPTTHGTTIYYKVSSKDDAAVTATSAVVSFKTP